MHLLKIVGGAIAADDVLSMEAAFIDHKGVATASGKLLFGLVGPAIARIDPVMLSVEIVRLNPPGAVIDSTSPSPSFTVVGDHAVATWTAAEGTVSSDLRVHMYAAVLDREGTQIVKPPRRIFEDVNGAFTSIAVQGKYLIQLGFSFATESLILYAFDPMADGDPPPREVPTPCPRARTTTARASRSRTSTARSTWPTPTTSAARARSSWPRSRRSTPGDWRRRSLAGVV